MAAANPRTSLGRDALCADRGEQRTGKGGRELGGGKLLEQRGGLGFGEVPAIQQMLECVVEALHGCDQRLRKFAMSSGPSGVSTLSG